ncbi:MAG: hypothetical protein WC972_11125 [Trueperaceae bacterium]
MDAEGFHEGVPCPRCGGVNTITYHYVEGFSELECPTCGYRSDAAELDALTRFESDLAEGRTLGATGGQAHGPANPDPDLPSIPRRGLKA